MAEVITMPRLSDTMTDGKVAKWHKKVGDKVNIGDKVICLEAMKMENVINSDKAGTITAVNIKKGDVVMEGDLIIQID